MKSDNDSGDGIKKNNFRKFKKLRGGRSIEERSDKKEKKKTELDEFSHIKYNYNLYYIVYRVKIMI